MKHAHDKFDQTLMILLQLQNQVVQKYKRHLYSKDYKQPIPRKLPDWIDMNLIGKGKQVKAQFNYKNK